VHRVGRCPRRNHPQPQNVGSRIGGSVTTPRHPAAWIAIVAGLVWLIDLGDRGLVAFVLAVVPGSLLVTGGLCTYILPGDVRLQSVGAVGGLLGVALSLPFLLFGVWMALFAGLLSA